MATSKLCAFLLIFILKNFYYLAFPPYCGGLDYNDFVLLANLDSPMSNQ